MGVSYTYGSDGTRLTKTVNGVQTSYTWDGAQLVSQTTTGGDTLYFLYHGSSRVGLEYKGNTYYYIYNLQGDVVGLVNSNGTSVVSYTYDAWGHPESVTGSMASTLGVANPFRYRGYYYDTESGLYYLMSRYYDPVVGRFINADGILAAHGDLLSFNLFTYCSNNPTNLADPAGDIAISTIILIGAVVGGLIAEGFSPENRERANNLINDPNPYNVGNWLTLGAFDTVKGAVQPEEPLSAQHWLDSAATATMIMVPASKLAARDPFQGLKNKLFKSPPKNLGAAFKPDVIGFQSGVNPNTLIPAKDLSTLSPQRIKNAVMFGGDQAIRVGRTGIIQDGHHRVADAIMNGRAIDIFVEPYK